MWKLNILNNILPIKLFSNSADVLICPDYVAPIICSCKKIVVIHDNLFIECKLRAKHSAIKLWDDTKSFADKEKKTPVIALCEKNRPGFWIMVHSDDFDKVSKELKNKKIIEEE